ncbi:hypothetical protein LCGC14_1519580, partial [marine sediment metagenome]
PELSLPSDPVEPRSPIGPGRRQRVGPPTLGPPSPAQFTEEQLGRIAPVTVGWTEGDLLQLETSLETVSPYMDRAWRDSISQFVMQNSGPEVLGGSPQEFYRQLQMSTEDMFTDKAVKRLLGIVSDEEAFIQSARDEWLETHYAVQLAADWLQRDDGLKRYMDENYLESDSVRDELKKKLNLDPAAEGTTPWHFSSDITGLRGKSLEWRQDGDALSMRWFTEDPKADDPEFVDVLIFLEEGVELVADIDAITEYMLAEEGLKNLVAPSSGMVPGRQAFVGALIEGVEDLWHKIERNGAAPLIEGVNKVLTQQANAVVPGITEFNPVPEQQAADEESLIEKENMVAVTREMDRMAVVAAARQAMIDNPELLMSQVVQAGIAGAAKIPQEEKEREATRFIRNLDLAEKNRQEDQSHIGRFFEEEVAPTLLDALDVFTDAIYYVGIVALDFTNMDAPVEVIQNIAEQGIAGILNKETLLALVPDLPDPDSLIREINNIREEGLPLAIAAYHESVKDTTFADFYGIDPDSPWAGWVNQVGLIAYDPITIATLGAAASWQGLRRGLTTAAGAERMVRSRPMMTAFKHIVMDNNVSIVTVFSEGGMRGPAIIKIARIAGTDYTTQKARVEAFQELSRIVVGEFPVSGHGAVYIPASSRAVLRRKTNLGLARLAGRAHKDSKSRSFLQDVLIRARQNRTIDMSDRGWLTEQFRIIEIKQLTNSKGFADDVIQAVADYEAYRVGDGSVALLEGRVQTLKDEIVRLDIGAQPAELTQVPRLRKQVTEWDDSIKELDLRIASAKDDTTRAALEQSRATALSNRDEVEKLLKTEFQFTGKDTATAYDDVVREVGRKRGEIKKLQGQAEELSTAGRDRSLLEHATLKYFDEWAGEWGVPVLRTRRAKSSCTPFSVTSP